MRQVWIVFDGDGQEVAGVFPTEQLAVEFVHSRIREDAEGTDAENVERAENCIAGEEYAEWGYPILVCEVTMSL